MSREELKAGDSVVVKAGTSDPDFEIDLAGWSGRVSEIDREGKLVTVAWDSHTLKAMPPPLITECEEEGLDWSVTVLDAASLQPAKPRDRQSDVERIKEKILDRHAWDEISARTPVIRDVLEGLSPGNDYALFEAWEQCFQKKLHFPFEAKITESQEQNGLKQGRRVVVERIGGIDQLTGVIVQVRCDHNEYNIPLCDIEVMNRSSENCTYVNGYALWFAEH